VVRINRNTRDINTVTHQPVYIDAPKVILANGTDHSRLAADTPALINKDGGCSAWKWAYQWLRVKKSVANSCSDDFNQNFANANSWSQCIHCQYAVFQIVILPRIYLL
jgi:hypothetical protein